MESVETRADDTFSAAQYFGGIIQTEWTKPVTNGKGNSFSTSVVLDFDVVFAQAPV